MVSLLRVVAIYKNRGFVWEVGVEEHIHCLPIVGFKYAIDKNHINAIDY